jgi:hypothetical protein
MISCWPQGTWLQCAGGMSMVGGFAVVGTLEPFSTKLALTFCCNFAPH